MLQEVSIWLYRINRAGYYSYRGNEDRAPLFCNLAAIFPALAAWADGKVLGQTATSGTGQGAEHAEAYLLDIHAGANGDFLVALWNRLPGNRHHVSSVGIGDVVGAASAEVTEIDGDRIPGFATYFWVMPAEARVAAISLKHMSHGLINFGNYVTSFLKNVNPDHVVLGDPGDDGAIVVKGYRPGIGEDAHPHGVRPTFSVKSIPKGGDLDYLRANVGQIARVICKTVITTQEPGDREWWQTLLDVSRIGKKPPAAIEEAPIRIELPVSLTLDELNYSIAAWQDDIDDSSENDLGFKLLDGTKKFLRKSHARDKQRLDVVWIDEELVNLEALLGQLQVHRARILALE